MRVESCIDAIVRARPNSLAMVFGERRWTYIDLQREMNRRAAVLAHAGLVEGNIAITAEPSSDEQLLTLLACCRVGVVLCWLSPLLTDAEVAGLATIAGAVVALTSDGVPRQALGVRPQNPAARIAGQRVLRCGAD